MVHRARYDSSSYQKTMNIPRTRRRDIIYGKHEPYNVSQHSSFSAQRDFPFISLNVVVRLKRPDVCSCLYKDDAYAALFQCDRLI